MCENAVLVVLTDCEIDIVSSDHVEIEVAELLDVLPFALVDVSRDLFVSEAVPKRQ